jgi:hypothetical protein
MGSGGDLPARRQAACSALVLLDILPKQGQISFLNWATRIQYGWGLVTGLPLPVFSRGVTLPY